VFGGAVGFGTLVGAPAAAAVAPGEGEPEATGDDWGEGDAPGETAGAAAPEVGVGGGAEPLPGSKPQPATHSVTRTSAESARLRIPSEGYPVSRPNFE